MSPVPIENTGRKGGLNPEGSEPVPHRPPLLRTPTRVGSGGLHGNRGHLDRTVGRPHLSASPLRLSGTAAPASGTDRGSTTRSCRVSVLACLWPPPDRRMWSIDHEGERLTDAPALFGAITRWMGPSGTTGPPRLRGVGREPGPPHLRRAGRPADGAGAGGPDRPGGPGPPRALGWRLHPPGGRGGPERAPGGGTPGRDPPRLRGRGNSGRSPSPLQETGPPGRLDDGLPVVGALVEVGFLSGLSRLHASPFPSPSRGARPTRRHCPGRWTCEPRSPATHSKRWRFAGRRFTPGTGWRQVSGPRASV